MAIGYIGWCGLGFKRGVNSYNYRHNDKETYLYSNMVFKGMFGTFLYGNPVLFPFFAYKELYRLETDIRNLEDEKKTRYYNDLV